MRRGFGLIQALLVIILISGIMTIAMKYANISVKQTSDLYVRESAELFMNSAVELTLLAISGYDRNVHGNCLHEVNITSANKRFTADVNITKYFLYNGNNENCVDRNQTITTEDSHGMVILELVVETNATHPKNQGKEIRLTRRTLQRP
jgi:competence protein ComGF